MDRYVHIKKALILIIMDETISKEEIAVLPGAFPWWIALVWGILAVILGLLFLTTPIATTFAAVTFIGCWWFVGGIFQLVSIFTDKSNAVLKTILALLSIIAGIVILAYPLYSTFLVATMVIILVSVWAIIIGATNIYQGFTTKDYGHVIAGIVSIIFGLLLLFYPVESAFGLPLVIGVFSLIGGIGIIIGSYSLKKFQEIDTKFAV